MGVESLGGAAGSSLGHDMQGRCGRLVRTTSHSSDWLLAHDIRVLPIVPLEPSRCAWASSRLMGAVSHALDTCFPSLATRGSRNGLAPAVFSDQIRAAETAGLERSQ